MLKKRQNEVKRNIFLFDEVKKHSRTSPEIQSKELIEILGTNENLTSRSTEQFQQKDNHKVEKLK